ncbi:LicD family protein [Halorientalis persicus]|uniref:LicD family protein n=1 Tax=Halorientalis persicus TaxID=1367881 RepID=A0A1H8VFN3_9EURY|nr:LicD family protein [Halorientalis persicus]SEP14201.1 LicD family protein [Halorientalis persicus]
MGALNTIRDLLEEDSLNYWVHAGTLLGLIREGRLLETDPDIDIGIWLSDVDQLLSIVNSIGGYRTEIYTYNGTPYQIKLKPSIKTNRIIDFTVFRSDTTIAWAPMPVANPLKVAQTTTDYMMNFHRVTIYLVWKLLFDGYRGYGGFFKGKTSSSVEITQLPESAFYTVGTLVVPKHYFDQLCMVDDFNIPAPNPPTEYLRYKFGDWQNPVNNWHFWTDDAAIKQAPPEQVIDSQTRLDRF